jgi:hypothetical protein
MANRMRRSNQSPQTQLRMEPHRTETTLTGARTWCGHAVFAHNLVKITALAA